MDEVLTAANPSRVPIKSSVDEEIKGEVGVVGLDTLLMESLFFMPISDADAEEWAMACECSPEVFFFGLSIDDDP